jgi:hypothetical protein
MTYSYDRYEEILRIYGQEVLAKLFPGIRTSFLGGGHSSNEFFFDLDFDALSSARPEYAPIGNRFVHFTSIQNLHSILNEGAVRLYSLDNSNDPREFSWVAQEFGYATSKLDSLKRATGLLSMCSPEVLTSPDSLNLWRFYGHNGWGCAIEFEFVNHVNDWLGDFMLGRVQYNKLDGTEFKVAHADFEKEHHIHVRIEEILAVPACFHKPELFLSEREVRLVKLDYHRRTPFDLGGHGYIHDFNRHGDVSGYWRLPLKQEISTHPTLRISAVQIGFQYSREKYNAIEQHLMDVFIAKQIARDLEIVPVISQSPLQGSFRV